MSVLDYLGSTKNITGAGLALGALAVTVPTGIAGPLWPVVVAGMYGVGALLAPNRKARLSMTEGASANEEAHSLVSEREDLERELRGQARRLPDDVRGGLDRVHSALSMILTRPDQLAQSPHQLRVVAATIRDYVPTSVHSYLQLPTAYAEQHRLGTGRTAHQELLAQLSTLAEELEKVRDAVLAGDAQALVDHSRFLQDKFRGSGLNLTDADQAALDQARSTQPPAGGAAAGPSGGGLQL